MLASADALETRFDPLIAWARERCESATSVDVLRAVARFFASRIDDAEHLGSRPLFCPALGPLSGHEAVGEDIALIGLLPGDGPAALGAVHQALLSRATRRAGGVYYTPPTLARRLVDFATEVIEGDVSSVFDPSVGGGAFLLAAGEYLVAQGRSHADAVESHLYGVDIDPLASAVADCALALWAAEGDRWPGASRLATADGLGELPASLDVRAGFDLVIGNPPFLSQLTTSTARGAEQAEMARARLGRSAFRYTDTSVLFLLRGCELARRGGVVALIQPESLLASSDATSARRALTEQGALVGLWSAGSGVFDAQVRVCAPLVRVGAGATQVQRRTGIDLQPAADAEPPDPDGSTWGPLVADLRGFPTVTLTSRGAVADHARATAGFRDQFYGVAPFVVEAADLAPGIAHAPLVTAGLIDPLTCRWGRHEVRFAGRRWEAPVVDLERLARDDAGLAAWTRARLVPKVVVATQTRVLEVVVDEVGCWYPSVPVISVEPKEASLWLVAAALAAPPVSAWALHAFAGAALSADTLRISSRQVLDVPLPSDRGAWDDGVAALHDVCATSEPDERRERLLVFGAVMTSAYGCDTSVTRWWADRLPPVRHE